MSQIKQDPEKLREYAHTLGAHGRYWKSSVAALSDYMARLGHSWRDEQFNDFEVEVRQIKNALEQYAEKVDTAVTNLQADADALEHFLKINIQS